MAQLKETTVTGGLTVDGVDVGEKMNLVDELNNNLEDIGREDSGWIDAELTSQFVNNGTNYHAPGYRKIGKMVEIRGVLKSTSELSADDVENNSYDIFTLPKGYRPSYSFYEVCQGNVGCTWRLYVGNNGTVRLSRYSKGGVAYTVSTSSFLPFHTTFFTD